MKRIKAFTLVEMLLVLVLSAIVVAVAYSVYAQLHLLGLEYEKRNTDATELLTFDQHVRFDARKAHDVRLVADGFVFMKEVAREIAKYTRNTAGIRRTTTWSNDNFNVQVASIRLDSNALVKTLSMAVGMDSSQSHMLSYTVPLPASARDHDYPATPRSPNP